ncbi:MAG: hypothetical protein LRY73_12360 [Bacillus sp. (in: Bacteria)]|nr:hypothetical protein [Bacillus sp. (in: firmicutes)]
MSEKQMDRFEGMLTQLVSMVGHLREDVEAIKVDISNVKADLSNVKEDLSNVKADLSNVKADLSNVKADVNQLKLTQEKQHAEVIGKLELLRADHEITWAKTVENEREIERLKKQILNN